MIQERKVALVTGASRGIGRGIALVLAQEGYDIVLNYQASAKAAKEVVQTIKKLGHEASMCQADVSDIVAVKQMVQQAIQTFGRIDVLINNAGIYERKKFEDLDPATWQHTLDINLTGVYHCCQAVVPHLQKQRAGVIVNISSQLGFMPSAHGCHYALSKAGVIGFTRSLALELAPFAIRVNAVAPGMIDHTSIMDVYGEVEKKQRAKIIPLQRLGTPEDIGHAVAFLCSEKASFITGETLHVNGGYLMR